MGHCQLNLRLHPEFRISSRTGDVNMHSVFFKGEEMDSVSFLSENRWTHFFNGTTWTAEPQRAQRAT
jgi:hypothetical protein